MTEKPNVGIKPSCPRCGSTEVRKRGFQIYKGGVKKQMWQCKTCGYVFREG